MSQQAITRFRSSIPAAGIFAIGVGITVCEVVFAYYDVAYGIVMSLVLSLIIYISLPLANLGKAFNDTAESLVLIPLYILLTSSLPWFFLNRDLLLPAVYSAVLALCIWHIYRKNINLREIGFRSGSIGKYVLIGMLVGVPLGSCEYFVITPAAVNPSFQVGYLLQQFVYMTLFVGLGEELLFRGLVQFDMTKLFGWKWGLLGASAIFGVMHFTWHSIAEVFFTFAAGAAFGFLYYRTRSLVAPIIAHGIGNTILIAVMPYIIHLRL